MMTTTEEETEEKIEEPIECEETLTAIDNVFNSARDRLSNFEIRINEESKALEQLEKDYGEIKKVELRDAHNVKIIVQGIIDNLKKQISLNFGTIQDFEKRIMPEISSEFRNVLHLLETEQEDNKDNKKLLGIVEALLGMNKKMTYDEKLKQLKTFIEKGSRKEGVDEAENKKTIEMLIKENKDLKDKCERLENKFFDFSEKLMERVIPTKNESKPHIPKTSMVDT